MAIESVKGMTRLQLNDRRQAARSANAPRLSFMIEALSHAPLIYIKPEKRLEPSKILFKPPCSADARMTS